MIGTNCNTTCKTPTPSQAHCSVCHRTFGGISGFDEHRSNGFCLDPAKLSQTERDQIWRRPMDEQAAERMRLIREQRGKRDDADVR